MRVAGPLRRAVDWGIGPRVLATVGLLGLTATYLWVLAHVVDVAGGSGTTTDLLLLVVGAGVLGLAASRVVGSGSAVVAGAMLLAAGLATYVLVAGPSLDLVARVVDTAALLSGLSVLRLTRAGLWAIALAPAPVFLSWYFLGRRAYGPAALVGGAALGFLVLSGDADSVLALVGVLGAFAAVGFGQLDRDGSAPALRNALVVVLVAALVLTTSVSLVPGGAAQPLLPHRGPATVEASLTDAPARVDVQGSISLSPTVRFNVTADRARYWRIGAFDRYTGQGWVRTGGSRPYDARLGPPPGDRVRPLRQRFVAESDVATMPAAWKPISVESTANRTRITELGGLRPTGTLSAGESYAVVSVVPDPRPRTLQSAGTDYPPAVTSRYLGLPASTPDRMGRFTTNLTAAADSPYRKAVIVQQWLQANKGYSLSVDRPRGDIASAFVFDMNRGYCTYFATAMVAMLRTQGIPARFVVGYTPGQQVGDHRWVVRGFDSHAWVEVYFPGVGWVQFDPTPAAPRRAAERAALQTARENGAPNVDPASGTPTSTPAAGSNAASTPTPTPTATGTPVTANGSAAPVAGIMGSPGEAGDGGVQPETVLYGLVLLLGAVTALAQLGALNRLYRAVWLRRLPEGPPVARVEATVERAEYLLGRRHRPRVAGETWRAYLDALDPAPPARTLFRLGERARYAGRASEADARRAARLLRELRS